METHKRAEASRVIDSFTSGAVINFVTAVTASHEIGTIISHASTNLPHERSIESDDKLDGSANKLESYTEVDLGSDVEHVDHKLAAMENVVDSKSTRHYSDELDDSTLIQSSADPRLARTAMGYHNYALVCADSKIHTDYCASGRRGYYCSQNGYVLLQVVSHLFLLQKTN